MVWLLALLLLLWALLPSVTVRPLPHPLERLRSARTRPTSAARPGELVTVMGLVVEHEELLRSPLAGTACVYYELTIDELVGDETRALLRERRGAPFFVEDSRGRLLVVPQAPITELPVSCARTIAPGETPDERAAAVLTRCARPREATSQLCIRERVLAPTDSVVVSAVCAGSTKPALNGYRVAPRPTLQLGGGQRQLVLSSAPATLATLPREQAPISFDGPCLRNYDR